MARINPLKMRLEAGRAGACMLITMPSVNLAQVLAGAGFYWLFIDLEHGPIDIASVHHLIAATAGTGCAPLVRIPAPDPNLCKPALDAGAMGLIFPMICTSAQAEATVPQVHAYLVVQRLENLRRSGRIGTAASWLGTALALKPLLRIHDGKLELAARVRTTSKATMAMVEGVLAVVGEHRAGLAVHHVNNPEGAAQVAATLASALPGCRPALVTDLGPVLGVHLGPGAVGVVLALQPD